MKKLLLLLSILFLFKPQIQASHVIGGEMGWTCLPTGKYIFHLTVYRDCTGIRFDYRDETITIVGNPLPKDDSGTQFSTIIVKPDSTRWITERNGDTSPKCNTNYGVQYSCDNGSPGTVQQFFYKSDAITLQGTPNRAGWKFYWESVCCRPGAVENINTTGTMLIRAEMNRTRDLDDTDPCVDSSPIFKALPNSFNCRAKEISYNSTAIDNDLDSLVYSWDRPYNPPYASPVALPYNTGYSPTNPTPDTSFDSRNIPSTINALSGEIKMAIYSGSGVKKYITVIKVDSYRDGVKISSVYREIPLAVIDCPTLPNGKENNAPKVVINGDSSLNQSMTVTAGQRINVPIEVIDSDFADSLETHKQIIEIVPEGLLFSSNKTSASPCQVTYGAGQNLVVEPCAYMQNVAPSLDTSVVPYKYSLVDTAYLSSEFVWQTDCKHVQNKSGALGTNESIYNFVFKVSDDACPIPATNYSTITVKVKDPVPLTEPIMKGMSVDLNGHITYQWVPAIDSAFSFGKYNVEESKTIDGLPPSQWNDLNTNLKVFQQSRKSPLYSVYTVKPFPSTDVNLLRKIPNRDWYLRMTAVSGCGNSTESRKSDFVQIIEPEVLPSGVAPNNSRTKASITWNAPKTDSAKSYDYFQYESETRYYVWQNDSVSNGGVADSANWYLRDSTLETEISLTSNVCGDYAAFRIEARDTVVTWKQGANFNSPIDSLDTLTFRTFSMIDTMFIVLGQPSVQRIGTELINADYPADSYQWIDCNADTIIPNANSREYIPSDTGTFAVIAVKQACKDTSDCYTVSLNFNDSIELNDKYTLRSLDSISHYQWYDLNSNSIIQGANKREYTVSDTGSYAVILSQFTYADTSNFIRISLNLNDSIVLIGKDTLKSLDTSAIYQWYNCGKKEKVPGANKQVFIPKDTGYYAVIVSDFGYSDTSACLPYFPVGLPKVQFKEQITYYPNPTTGNITIQLERRVGSMHLQVRNIQGQLMQEKQVVNSNSFQLELPQEAGIYFIQLINEKGERANLKVVKQ